MIDIFALWTKYKSTPRIYGSFAMRTIFVIHVNLYFNDILFFMNGARIGSQATHKNGRMKKMILCLL